jgi:hypothetical protein
MNHEIKLPCVAIRLAFKIGTGAMARVRVFVWSIVFDFEQSRDDLDEELVGTAFQGIATSTYLIKAEVETILHAI